MIDKSSIDKLNALNLDELVDILHRQESVAEFISMPFDQRLQFAIDDFYSVRMEQNYKRLLAKAHLKYPGARFHSIEYLPERNLDRNTLTQLATGNFLNYATDIAIFGISGSGKSFIACCLGTMACTHGRRTLFYRMPDLLSDYACIETAQQRKRFITKLARVDLLIIDEWLGNGLTEKEINLIFEIVEKRTEVHSTIFCSQYAPQYWYARLGESTQCESILNRIFSGLCRVNCGAKNMRDHYSLSKLRN